MTLYDLLVLFLQQLMSRLEYLRVLVSVKLVGFHSIQALFSKGFLYRFYFKIVKDFSAQRVADTDDGIFLPRTSIFDRMARRVVMLVV